MTIEAKVKYLHQRVSVDHLKLGMYVSALDRPWLETNFVFQGFHLRKLSDIERLREECDYVFVDPERGVSVPREHVLSSSQHEQDKLADAFRNPCGDERYPIESTVEEEINLARSGYNEALDLVSNVLQDFRTGRTVKTRAVKKTLGKMISSILRNPDAFMWLKQLKDRDSYTYSHCVDASGLAVTFGRHLGLPKSDLETLAAGTLLFDIGKLQLPEELLKKPGRLTDKEYALIKRHVEFGARMVSEMQGSTRDIMDIVLHHHERHDGKGYPRRVAGHRIPVNGRIAALVDCYDAITSDRPYSEAMPSYEAIRLIYEFRGKDFQPDMVEQFIQCIGLYPVGTLVELSTGEVGIVMAQNRLRRLRPKVLLVLDKDKVAYDFNPVVNLLDDPVDDKGNTIEIHRPLNAHSYGIDAKDYYL